MEYQRFDPSLCGFPRPRVPPLPGLSRASLGGSRLAPGFELVGRQATDTLHFSRGRYALTEAYRRAGVGPKGGLLAPAYHCRTMLDPAIRLGADIGLYGLGADLTPDLAGLEAALAAARTPIKALLLTHYFGFAQKGLAAVADFCTRHGLVLIEDCSHALLSRPDASTPIGGTGQFAVASPYKFFASDDGGLFWANGGASHRAEPLSRPGIAEEIKSGLRGLQQWLGGSIAPLNTESLGRELKDWVTRPLHPGLDVRQLETGNSEHYSAAEEMRQSLASSRWIAGHTDLQLLASRRRENYQRWVGAVADLPACRALFPLLPDDCVPYMFALHIKHPTPHFYALKHLGLPVWRWDDMAVSDCAVAMDYRLHLLHLPCHQELSDGQMDWMIAALTAVMTQLTPEPAR